MNAAFITRCMQKIVNIKSHWSLGRLLERLNNPLHGLGNNVLSLGKWNIRLTLATASQGALGPKKKEAILSRWWETG